MGAYTFKGITEYLDSVSPNLCHFPKKFQDDGLSKMILNYNFRTLVNLNFGDLLKCE